MAKKTYVIDTSVFLSDANALYRFKNNDILIPMKVLEEVDGHKKRQDSVGFNARLIIKHLDNLRISCKRHPFRQRHGASQGCESIFRASNGS